MLLFWVTTTMLTDDVNGDSENENNGHHGDVNESAEVK